MHIVELGVLLPQPLEGVPGQLVPAMVVQAFHGAERDEPHRLPGRELCDGERGDGADCVEDEGFGEGGIEGPEGVGDVDLCDKKGEVRVMIS